MTLPHVHLRLDNLPASGARLRVERIRWTDSSFQVFAFLNLPTDRWPTATMDDEHFIDAFFMYGAGQRRATRHGDSSELYLSATFTIRPQVVEKVGRPGTNDVVFIARNLVGTSDAADTSGIPLDMSHIMVEALDA